MAQRLVRFDTTSQRSNLELIDFVRNYLDEFGVSSALTFDADARKANLLATIGPQEEPGIVLSGHTDVVPVADQTWSSDPFSGVIANGRLLGRGSCDMKGFIGVVLAAVPDMLDHGLRKPIHIVLSYDEEVGCIGARQLVAQIAEMPVKPLACIVGEPTGMGLALKHKGKKWFRCGVHGKPGHSCFPLKGVNAIDFAAELIVHLRDVATRLRVEGPFDTALDPPYTTMHTGVIRGGTSYNVIPSQCEFDFEIRHLPAQEPTALVEEVERFITSNILPRMHAADSSTGITLELVSEYPGLDTRDEEAIVQFVEKALGQSDRVRIGYSTEAGLFQKGGTPTVVCGPGDVSQAHKADEFVTTEQLEKCASFIQGVIRAAAAVD